MPAYRQPSPPPGYQQPPQHCPLMTGRRSPLRSRSIRTKRRQRKVPSPSRRCFRSQCQNPNARRAPHAPWVAASLPISNELPIGASRCGRGAGEPLDLGEYRPAHKRWAQPAAGGPGAGRRWHRAYHPAADRPSRRDEFRSRHRLHAAARIMRWPKRPCAILGKNIPAIPCWRIPSTGLAKVFSSASSTATPPNPFSRSPPNMTNPAKAPDALLRLGQSLAALKEREAACAALRRGHPKISARIERRQGGRGSRAEKGQMLRAVVWTSERFRAKWTPVRLKKTRQNESESPVLID